MWAPRISFRNTFGFSLLKEWLLSDHLLVVEYSISHILVHLIIFQHFYTYFIAGNMETYQRVSSKLKLEKVGDQYVGKPNSNLLKSRTNTGETDTGGPVKTGNRISLNFTSGETFLLPFLIKMGFSLFPSHPSHLDCFFWEGDEWTGFGDLWGKGNKAEDQCTYSLFLRVCWVHCQCTCGLPAFFLEPSVWGAFKMMHMRCKYISIMLWCTYISILLCGSF